MELLKSTVLLRRAPMRRPRTSGPSVIARALNSRKAAENLAKVEALVTRCTVLNVTVATAKVYAELRLALRQKGKPIPENDLWIPALCVEHQVPLAAADAHFDSPWLPSAGTRCSCSRLDAPAWTLRRSRRPRRARTLDCHPSRRASCRRRSRRSLRDR